MENIAYLGDGVYLNFDGFQYWLAVGEHTNNVVALEPEVYLNLTAAVYSHKEKLSKSS